MKSFWSQYIAVVVLIIIVFGAAIVPLYVHAKNNNVVSLLDKFLAVFFRVQPIQASSIVVGSQMTPTPRVVWERRGPKGIALSATADPEGNVYVAGFNLNDANHTGQWYVVKYALNGQELWSYEHHISQVGVDVAYAIAYSPEGFVAVVGYVNGGGNLRVEKLDAATGALLWSYAGDGGAASVVVGQNGIIYTAGSDGNGVKDGGGLKRQWLIKKINTSQ